MNLNVHPLLLVLGLLVLCGLCLFALIRLADGNRDDKKRRRNYGRVISRVKRPIVMLSVKTDKR